MNNLKRVLSLALSGIMLVGMMAVGASAADFTDAADIQHDDAVNVLVSLNVINGQDDGSFNPTGDVTRGQMAKMIAVAMNGGKETNTGVKGTASFTDIKGHWAESYIEYCYDLSIISGRGDGTFDPDGKVTGLEATKMVLTALGYDAEAYKLVGASWAVRTDELAKKADPNLYDELGTVVMANNASRDTAAQLIWNGLQNVTRRVTPDTNTNTGEVTWTYGTSGKTMLEERYDALVWLGTYAGNSKSLGLSDDGCVRLSNAGPSTAADNARNANPTFVSDMGIENLGEEVKVIFKDGNGGTKGSLDKKDIIYGVFNTGAVETVTATLNDIKDGDDAAEAGKVKIGDTTYTMAADADIAANSLVKNYGATATTKVSKTAIEGLKAKTGDTIKLILKDGKVNFAVVTETKLARITAVSSGKITISGVGSIEIKDNDVYDGVAKDDVVTYTKFYNSDKDKAFFTVTKAETVEGEITGFDGTKKVSIDGTSYNIEKDTLATSLTDEVVTSFTGKIGDEVKAYLVGGMVGAVQNLTTDSSSYALVIGATGNATSDSTLSTGRVRLLLTDGTKVTYEVDEKSELQPTDAASPSAKQVKAGTLVKFSVTSSNTVKMSKKYNADDPDKKTGAIWNSDTKVIAGDAVAESGAVLFYNSAAANAAEPSYKVTDIRGLKSISDSADVYVIKNDSGKIVAAYTELNTNPAGATSTRVYGMITGSNGTVKVSDDECTQYKVWTGEDEILVNITDDVVTATMTSGNYVTFEETVDSTYKQADILLVSNYDTSNVTIVDGAVKEYNTSDKTLSYYKNLAAVNDDGLYLPEKESEADDAADKAPETIAMDKDLKIVYVDRNGKKAGDEVGVNAYDTTTGYANVKLMIKDDVVIVMFVETSGECNINGTKTALEPTGGAASHSHTWSAFTDESGTHKRTCSGAGTCDATENDKQHTGAAASEYTKDEAQHWKVCATEGCDIIMEAKANHDTNGANGVCSVCGYDPNA